MTQTATFQPGAWLTSLFRSLKEYVDTYTNDIYEMTFDFSPSDIVAKRLPLEKTIIGFTIDDIENPTLGYGRTVVETTVTNTVTESEILPHMINFDVGVWASARTGGTTARLQAYELLARLFVGVEAYQRCLEATEGVEIFSFHGGRFVVEHVNDLEVYRIVGGELVVKVYSAETGEIGTGYTPYTIDQDPELTIQDTPITDSP